MIDITIAPAFACLDNELHKAFEWPYHGSFSTAGQKAVIRSASRFSVQSH